MIDPLTVIRNRAITPPAADRVVLEARGLDFFYGRTQALFGIDLAIERHVITALIGPPGRGKSTLLRSLNRIHELYPTSTRPAISSPART